MPLILKNQQEVKTQEQTIAPVPQPVQKPKIQETVTPTPVSSKPVLDNVSHDDHILVVNGKHKKVSKKSSYLLDMLVIDDE